VYVYMIAQPYLSVISVTINIRLATCLCFGP